MTTNKEATNTAPSRDSSQPIPECCMCGDYGLSNELFHCKVCQFRSQHRYCSNLYPTAESYQVCNWCLSQKDDKEKSQNSSNSSSSNKTNSEEDSKNRRKNSGHGGGMKGQQRSSLQLQLNKPIKKQKSPERSPPTRKRIITNGALEEKLRRTKSEVISNNNRVIVRKPVFRNKVRRYKLLDEVSS
ncbi:Zinc ion binding protein [Melia azedarach]|uniref:Zinc ion binding protein n=1 Tax=Melia azedarach TaxID=155640 RepID=A0ACC1WQG5_MELAZ|nr:Zinc ion binding protein [Melia azedarach]